MSPAQKSHLQSWSIVRWQVPVMWAPLLRRWLWVVRVSTNVADNSSSMRIIATLTMSAAEPCTVVLTAWRSACHKRHTHQRLTRVIAVGHVAQHALETTYPVSWPLLQKKRESRNTKNEEAYHLHYAISRILQPQRRCATGRAGVQPRLGHKPMLTDFDLQQYSRLMAAM